MLPWSVVPHQPPHRMQGESPVFGLGFLRSDPNKSGGQVLHSDTCSTLSLYSSLHGIEFLCSANFLNYCCHVKPEPVSECQT